MDFFELGDHLAEPAGVPDAMAWVRRAWHLRQRDTRAALAACAAAEAWPAGLAQAERARIALVRAEAAWLLGDDAPAQQQLGLARGAFEALADAAGVGDALLCEAFMLDLQGGDSVAKMHQAAQAYARSGDALRIALADAWLACVDSTAAHEEAALRWNATLERVRRLGHPGLSTYTHGALASQAYQRGDVAGAVEHFEHSFDAALQSGQLFSAITVAQNLGIAFSALGDDEGALHWVQRARALVGPTGWPYATSWTLVQSASVLVGMGRAEAAREMLVEGMPLLERHGASRNYALATQIMAEAALQLGDPAQALLWSERSQATAAGLNFPDLAGSSLRLRAQALSRLGRPADAMTAARTALQIARDGKDLRHESTTLAAMALIARSHALPAPAGSHAGSAALHWQKAAFDAGRRIDGFTPPQEWHAALSQDLQAAGDLAGALEQQRLATAALEQSRAQKALSLAVAMQVRHRTETSRVEAEHQRALAQASQERVALLQAGHQTLEQLAAIGQSITRGLEPQAVYATLARHAGTLLDAASIAVWRVDAQDPARLVLAWGVEDGRPLPPGREPADPQAGDTLSVPLLAGDEALGVLEVRSARRGAYGEREHLILRSLGAATAVALANSAQAERLALAERALEHQRMQGLLVHAGKMVAVGRLASGVVHEMSHPVGTLLLLAEALADALQARDPEAAAGAREMQHEAERLAQIVRRLRNFARADSPQLALHGLRAVLADARALYGPRLAMEHIACDESVPPLLVWADTERLSLAIANLVFNAADAMAGRTGKRLWITASQSPGRVEIAVRDNGPGLSDAVAARLFEPFFTTKPEGQGLGLGLAVSAESLAGMHGRITAMNASEGGAVFTLDLLADDPGTPAT